MLLRLQNINFLRLLPVIILFFSLILLFGFITVPLRNGADVVVAVNRDDCVGCGICEYYCSDVFTVVDGRVKIIGQPSIDLRDSVEEAKRSCPFNCIVTNW